MNVQQLYYFVKIAELEHYTKAAEALCITQPCLSYAISELEKELNVALFFKQGRNIRLTQYGEAFLIHVRKALQELEIGKKTVEELANPGSGRIALSYVSALNTTLIPFLVEAFYENPENKNIKFDFSENPTKKTTGNLKQGKMDVGFASKIDDDELEFFPVYKEDMVLIVGPKHPLAERVEISLKEIEEYPYVAYEKDCGIRDHIDKIFEKAGVKQNIVCEVVDNITITGIVSAMLGVSVVPRRYGNEYYKVKAIEIREEQTPRELYMMWRKKGSHSPSVEKFIQFVMTMTSDEIMKYIAERNEAS